VATKALLKLSNAIEEKSARLISEFPFGGAFSAIRKRAIVKMLALRADILNQVLAKGGAHEETLAIQVQDAPADSARSLPR
jgi:hypothetical protein